MHRSCLAVYGEYRLRMKLVLWDSYYVLRKKGLVIQARTFDPLPSQMQVALLDLPQA